MRYVIYQPPPELRNLVRDFWILEYNQESSRCMDYSLFADCLSNLVVQYKGDAFLVENGGQYDKTPLGHFSGQFNKAVQMKSRGVFGMIGAYLYPKAVSQILKLKPEEVTNCNLDLRTLFGSESELLQEQINEAGNDEDRLQILGAFLDSKAQKRNSALDAIDVVVHKVLSKKGAISVMDLAGFAGYSIRQLERTFRSHTGFTPKYFSRIVRFQQAMKSYDNSEVKSLSELAYHSGYSDQAHFIREFKEFSGMKPRLYFKELKEVASSFVQI